jgi:hypothetical protein
MLDYATNAKNYWRIEDLRSLAETQAGGAQELADKVAVLIQADPAEDQQQQVERYWGLVEENLRSGKLRLLFVADHIPKELRSIIEFLNEKMPDIHVVGLELVQYQHGEVRVMVPRVVGQTEAARGAKARRPGQRLTEPKTTEPEFLNACPEPARPAMKAIIDQAQRRGLTVFWGTRGFSVRTRKDVHGKVVSLVYGYPPGVVYKSEAHVELYVRPDIFTDAERAGLESVMDVAPFEKARTGQYTLRLPLRADTVPKVPDALKRIWDVEQQMVVSQSAGPARGTEEAP